MHPISFRNIKQGAITMQFPRQYLIYLGQGQNVPDVFPITIRFLGEEDHIHYIPVIRFQEEALDVLVEQKMFILLPFRLIRIRRELAKSQSEEQLRALIEQYKNDIIDPINLAHTQGYISWRDRLNLFAIARRLERHLFASQEAIQKGLADMRFQTLDLDIDEYDEKYEALEEKYVALEEKLAEQSEQLAEKDRHIQELEAQLAALQNN